MRATAVPVEELERRRAALGDVMAEDGADLAVATQGSAWTEYVSGVTRLEGRPADNPEEEANFCVFQPGGEPRFRLVHSNWKLEVEPLVHDLGYGVLDSVGDAPQTLRQLVDREPHLIWVSGDMPFALVDIVQRAYPGARLAPFPDGAWRVRCRKSELEIDCLRRAARLTAAVHRDVARSLPSRFTRWELLEEYRHRCMAAGAGALAVPVNVHVLQKAGIFAWGRPLDRAATDVIEPPALISVDVGARVGGYCADMGRTLLLGEVPAPWMRAYAVAWAAQSRALTAIAPLVRAGEVDGAARRHVEGEGLSEAFWIPVGHGIGLDVHERPLLTAAGTAPIEVGMTLAVEVGLWSDQAAAFVEDVVVVTEDGAEPLTRSPQAPLAIG